MKPNLVFSWLGSDLPSYAIQSLELNLNYSSSNIYLVTESANISRLSHHYPSILPRITLIPVETFYSQPLELATKNYYGDLGYRNGFWLRTFERFYVLDALLSSGLLQSFFHAELDNICFGLDRLQKCLKSLPFSSYFVQDNKTRAVLSLAYLNGPQALKQFLSFLEALPSDHKFNDMHDLGAYLHSQSTRVAALPNESAFLTFPKWDHLSLSQVHGICDANAIGQYLLGLDFRITRRITNLFKNENLFINLDHFNFVISSQRDPSCPYYGPRNLPALKHKSSTEVIPIYNIHVHSKSFAWLSSIFLIRILFFLVNLRLPIPILSFAMLTHRLTRIIYRLLTLNSTSKYG